MSSKFYDIKYQFSSPLEDVEGSRYLTSYEAKVYELEDVESRKRTLIGKFELKLILVNLAANDGYPLHEIIDTEEYTFRIGELIFDLDDYDFKEEIQEFYSYSFGNSDVCLLTRIEIKESHRRKGIGRKIIKDIYNRFSSSCGLFVVQAFPLQFEQKLNVRQLEALPDWSIKMNYASLESDFEKAFYQLKAFYQKIGFDHLEGFNELMFLNPALRNDKMDNIRLE